MWICQMLLKRIKKTALPNLPIFSMFAMIFSCNLLKIGKKYKQTAALWDLPMFSTLLPTIGKYKTKLRFLVVMY